MKRYGKGKKSNYGGRRKYLSFWDWITDRLRNGMFDAPLIN
jgi:hypothetical protein